MTLAVSNLTSGHSQGNGLTGIVTASVSPAGGSLLVLSVGGYDGTTTQDFTVSSVSGFSATWTRQKLGVAGSTPKGDVEVWTATMPGSPGSGTVTATLSSTVSNAGLAWSLDQASGQNASTPVVTGNTVAGNNSSAASSVTFAAAASSSNLFLFLSVVLLAAAGSITQSPSESPAWTSLAQLQSDTTSANGVSLNVQVSPDVTHLTGSASWSGSHSWGTIGIEISAATGTSANAGDATGSGAAGSATPGISPAAGDATGTGGVLAASAGAATGAGSAAGTGSALAASVAVSPPAGLGAGTGGALAVVPGISIPGGVAGGDGAALGATAASSGTSASAGLAAGAGTAHDATAGVPAAKGTGAWWGLHSVLAESRSEYDAYWSRPPLDCPICAQPLVNAPSAKSGSGVELFCNYAGDHEFHYPRDREQPTRLDAGALGGGGW